MECYVPSRPRRDTAIPDEGNWKGGYGSSGIFARGAQRLIRGQNYSLPSRKAAPLAQSPNADGAQSPTASLRGNELHSPLSPLSPGSPIFPDGVFTPLWFAKHQDQVPALFLAFFDITADDGSAQNEQIQIDINAIRTAFARSGFKTRFAAVLMSDKSILQSPGLEDRLSAIRRATTLDPKSGLFFMPPMSSQAEISTFVHSMLTTFQPLIVELYRDLTKHSRRKKSRGGPAPSVNASFGGSSQTLSTPGWNARYEIKQGALAEFRQEMDSAERYYSAAIEELFHPEGVLEATPSWSPRWNDARLLSDALAIRVLRCELWSGLTTGAATSWTNYRARMKDLVDRRGKGSDTYSWAAWESRWALIMARLVSRAQIPIFRAPPQQTLDVSVVAPQLHFYAAPEKVFERLPPFHFLHHPGYWQRLAANGLRIRQAQALAIPEEDRIRQEQLPASAVTSRNQRYDRYLVPDSSEEFGRAGVSSVQNTHDHLSAHSRLIDEAVGEFSSRGQARMSEQLRLDSARSLVEVGRYSEAMAILLPLWEGSSWRNDDWHDLFYELLMLLHQSAKEEQNARAVLITTWERLGCTPTSSGDIPLEVENCLDGFDVADDFAVAIQDTQHRSPLEVSFAFADPENHVGEGLECQLTVASRASAGSSPITLSRIVVELTSRSVCINHTSSERLREAPVVLVDLSKSIESDDSVTTLETQLGFQPKQSRVFCFQLTFREAQVIRLTRVSLVLQTSKFRLEHAFTDADLLRASSISFVAGEVVEQRSIPHADPTAITILSKPPKMQLVLHGLHSQCYTDERLRLNVELLNEEGEEVKASVIAKAVGEGDHHLRVRWDGIDNGTAELHIAKIEALQSRTIDLVLDAPIEASVFTLYVEVKYSLASDPDSVLSKELTTELKFAVPFDANFEFGPLLDPSPWPSYFQADATGTKEDPSGIAQRWRLGCKVHSLSEGHVLIQGMKLILDAAPQDAQCALPDHKPGDARTLAPAQIIDTGFEFSTRKFSLDDRRPTSLDLSLEVRWSRAAQSELVTTTSMPVPRLVLPSSEPRVLCTVAERNTSTGHVTLHYHLENPSMHFLTFAMSMDANDEFAFSGPKYRTLSLAPLSRHWVEYRLLAHDVDRALPREGAPPGEAHWIWPPLQVVDSYYQKNLKVHSGGAGVKVDEKRGLGVLVS